MEADRFRLVVLVVLNIINQSSATKVTMSVVGCFGEKIKDKRNEIDYLSKNRQGCSLANRTLIFSYETFAY